MSLVYYFTMKPEVYTPSLNQVMILDHELQKLRGIEQMQYTHQVDWRTVSSPLHRAYEQQREIIMTFPLELHMALLDELKERKELALLEQKNSGMYINKRKDLEKYIKEPAYGKTMYGSIINTAVDQSEYGRLSRRYSQAEAIAMSFSIEDHAVYLEMLTQHRDIQTGEFERAVIQDKLDDHMHRIIKYYPGESLPFDNIVSPSLY